MSRLPLYLVPKRRKQSTWWMWVSAGIISAGIIASIILLERFL